VYIVYRSWHIQMAMWKSMSFWILSSWRIGSFRYSVLYMNSQWYTNCLKSCNFFLSFLFSSFSFEQAEIQNVIDSVSTFGKASCFSASISWNPQQNESQEPSFVLGFNSDTPQLNSSKVGVSCIWWKLYYVHFMPVLIETC
jgi:hypothetical protein